MAPPTDPLARPTPGGWRNASALPRARRGPARAHPMPISPGYVDHGGIRPAGLSPAFGPGSGGPAQPAFATKTYGNPRGAPSGLRSVPPNTNAAAPRSRSAFPRTPPHPSCFVSHSPPPDHPIRRTGAIPPARCTVLMSARAHPRPPRRERTTVTVLPPDPVIATGRSEAKGIRPSLQARRPKSRPTNSRRTLSAK
jgi:hypothetical protein